MNIAYNRDCMEAMREYPDKYFDLAVVDPPYGITVDKQSLGAGTGLAPEKNTAHIMKSRLKGGGKLKNRAINAFDTSWDAAPPGPEYFTELFRVSKNQVIWGGVIISSCLLRVELFVGIKSKLSLIFLNGKWRGQALISRQKYSVFQIVVFNVQIKARRFTPHRNLYTYMRGFLRNWQSRALKSSTLI